MRGYGKAHRSNYLALKMISMKHITALFMFGLCCGVDVSSSGQSLIASRTLELGGDIAASFQNSDREKDISFSTFAASIYTGLMVSHGFEVGVYPSFVSIDYGNGSQSQFEILLAPAYNINLKTNIYPYIEFLGGIGTADGFSNERISSLGGNVGFKIILRESSMFLFRIQYLNRTINPHDDYISTGKYSLDAINLGLGFRVFFNSGQKKE